MQRRNSSSAHPQPLGAGDFMAKDTPSMAKNKMRRCFAAIFDPYPSSDNIDSLWEHFDSRCAYCGEALVRAKRSGHLDHVKAASDGGSNSIYNFVLSCACCNGDEKREASWVDFLDEKSKELSVEFSVAETRKRKIAVWVARESPQRKLDVAMRKDADAIIKCALESFEEAVRQLRVLRQGGS